jgi:hypothetical protein
MTKYVIGPDVAIRLAHDQAVIRDEHQILAPALLRSQVLSLLYQAVHRGEMTKAEADRQLSYLRGRGYAQGAQRHTRSAVYGRGVDPRRGRRDRG